MRQRTMIVSSRAYQFTADAAPALTERRWSVVQGRAVDEITGDGLTVALRVEVSAPQIDPRAGDGGIFTLMARPGQRFQPLLATGYRLHFTVTADGYLKAAQAVTVPTYQRTLAAPAPAVGARIIALSSTTGLMTGQRLSIGPLGPTQERPSVAHLGPGPHQLTLTGPLAQPHAVGDPVAADEFRPVTLPDLLLHRTPVVIRGRTVRRNAVATAPTFPVANATIQVQGIWRTRTDLRHHRSAAPATLVSLVPGLYAARGVGATLLSQDLPVVAGQDKLLLEAVAAGSTTIRISNRHQLSAPPAPPPYSVLRIDADHPELAEYLSIQGLTADGTADEPTRVTIAHPLGFAHRPGVRVQLLQPQPPGAAKLLTAAAAAGDVCLFLSNLAGLAGAATVRISGGGASDEYQQVRTFTVTSDADGYFALPPLSRVAQVHLQASAAALTAVELDFQPDYGRPDNWLDLVFS